MKHHLFLFLAEANVYYSLAISLWASASPCFRLCGHILRSYRLGGQPTAEEGQRFLRLVFWYRVSCFLPKW
ncbi:hypothetical protein AKJ16_DCAP12781 [Drosera capensis]